MKKQLLLLLALAGGIATQAQVKVGTNPTVINSSSILEVESTTKAVLLPRVATTAAVVTPINGMIVYDISSKCIKAYENGAWSDCLSTAAAAVTVNCASGGFTGTYAPATALSGAKYSAVITNNSFSSATIAFSTADLVLSGITGYSVTAVSVASVTLASGQSATIDYTLSGTSATTGTLTGVWTKLNLKCTNTVAVSYPATATSVATGDVINGFQTTLLSDKGPYAANSLTVWSNSYMDYGMQLSGDLKEAQLNTTSKTVWSNVGVTTLGGSSGTDVTNGYNIVICPNNSIVTGIEVFSTSFMDYYLHLQCTALNSGYSTEVGTGSVDSNIPADVIGGNQTATCPAGQYMKGVQIYCTSYLDYGMGLYCTTITP